VDDTQTPAGALWLSDDARVQRSSGSATAGKIASLSRSGSAASSSKRRCLKLS
jgi:hypothetical protein